MELSKNYIPSVTEARWYKHWTEKGYFKSRPDERPPYTVVIPPPNVTGVLHMGHTLNETVQDILVRKARMSGFNACWVPGSDHASIATEAKVVQMLKEKGIDKNELSREEFLKYAFEWKDKYGDIIYNQIEKLGCSVDWERVTFTMDDHYYKSVIKVFIDLYNKGLIYRGARMINWDPAAKTALSDEEVEFKDIIGKLYYLNYILVDDEGQLKESTPNSVNSQNAAFNFITIATQRPETIMGDTAICVNPNDERYKHLKGKFAIVPLINRRIPIIFDEYVDPVFGTGALKVTPAHDINDYNLGLKHHLEVVDTLNPDGTLSAAAQIYIGEDRFVARKKIIAELQEKGFLINEEEYASRLGHSQRSGAVVEPRISTQWFVKMKELARPALNAVVDGEIRIHPGDKFLATYKYWLENVKDWCISRQLWWGQQIPAWYDEKGNYVVAETYEAAIEKYKEKFGQQLTDNDQLKQDADVLDTWFSSWLWPMEVFKGISDPENHDINYYYPTSVLVTGQDIIFFWVARMIMAGMHYRNEKPFSDVYFTGMVRDKLGRKMSKSLGNSPDLLQLIDKYGADAVRFGIMISSPAGNDLLFDEASLEQGRNFNNKLWNALKLVKMWEGRTSTDNTTQEVDDNWRLTDETKLQTGEIEDLAEVEKSRSHHIAIDWFENRLNEVRAEVEVMYSQFKLSEALKSIYSLIWDDFCSWYLEWVKPGFEQRIEEEVYDKTVWFFEELLQMLHPFMPFISEEIYHLLREREDDLCVKQFPKIEAADQNILAAGELLKQVISALRDARNKNQLKPKETIKLHVQSANGSIYKNIEEILAKQINAEKIYHVNDAVPNAIVIAVEKDKFYIECENQIDTESLKNELLKDLQHQKNFLQTVIKKLGNERFVANAKAEIVELEKKKQADAEARIKTIEETLASL
ncbi:valine--tRNA ligase [Segetibacter koreensis]|uniref:valine--tRNA ligase n=1 Tax=Segetibacter koreensis TaxID=398037 RepID=UPI00037E4940|nr:valine--tRNA ligase [Segetibacter koreensis]